MLLHQDLLLYDSGWGLILDLKDMVCIMELTTKGQVVTGMSKDDYQDNVYMTIKSFSRWTKR